MATFVLVHGASLGGWCWRVVSDLLQARGHSVETPTLTGMGERHHLRPESIQTHLTDIAAMLMYRDLRAVHLVLHGYAGALAGPLAAGSDRIASIVYLSGLIVPPGEVVPDVPGGLPEWGVTAPSDLVCALPRMTPWTCCTEPLSYDPTALARLRQTYIRTTAPPTAVLEQSWQRAREAGWETQELTSGFAAMIAAPRQTARLLEACGPQDALPPVFPASPRIALW